MVMPCHQGAQGTQPALTGGWRLLQRRVQAAGAQVACGPGRDLSSSGPRLRYSGPVLLVLVPQPRPGKDLCVLREASRGPEGGLARRALGGKSSGGWPRPGGAGCQQRLGDEDSTEHGAGPGGAAAAAHSCSSPSGPRAAAGAQAGQEPGPGHHGHTWLVGESPSGLWVGTRGPHLASWWLIHRPAGARGGQLRRSSAGTRGHDLAAGSGLCGSLCPACHGHHASARQGGAHSADKVWCGRWSTGGDQAEPWPAQLRRAVRVLGRPTPMTQRCQWTTDGSRGQGGPLWGGAHGSPRSRAAAPAGDPGGAHGEGEAVAKEAAPQPAEPRMPPRTTHHPPSVTGPCLRDKPGHRDASRGWLLGCRPQTHLQELRGRPGREAGARMATGRVPRPRAGGRSLPQEPGCRRGCSSDQGL